MRANMASRSTALRVFRNCTANILAVFAAVCVICAGTPALAQDLPALPNDLHVDTERLESIRQTAEIALIYLIILALIGAAVIAVLTLRHRRALSDIERLAGLDRERVEEIEQARRQSDEREAYLRAVLDNMLDGVLTVDERGLVQSFNPVAERLFGYAPKELFGMNVIKLFGLEDQTVLSQFLGKATVLSDVPLEGLRREAAGVGKDGAVVALEVSFSQMQIDGEQQFIILCRDIAGRKKAQAQVSAAENRLLQAINALPDGFVLFDAADRLVICNDKYREIYKSSADLIRTGARFEDMVRAGMALGQYPESEGREEAWLTERMRKHRSAKDVVEQQVEGGRWLRIFEQRTPDGGTVGFRVDITEIKRREAELLRSENLFRATVAGASDGIIVTDEKGRILAFNPAAESIFGYSAADAAGVGVYDLLLPEPICSRYKAGLATYLETGHGPLLSQRREETCLRKDGSTVLVDVAVRVSEGDGERLLIANIRDITNEKARAVALQEAKEKAEVANLAKASFLAMMSHEIRTPLNGVLGVLEVLGDTELTAKQGRYVHTARESGQALLAIINDILVFSKLEAGKFVLEPVAESLSGMLEGIRDLLAPRADERHLSLEVSIEAGTPDTVWVDAGSLRQILLNLVGNALKFTESGRVSIELSVLDPDGTDGREDAQHLIRFTVRDTGIGIQADKIPDLFAEFATLDASYSRRYEGTGLGLAICRELVSRMGGRIEVHSTVGAGSVFWFDLPLNEAPRNALSVENQIIDPQDLATLTGMRILLAEDNATNRMVLSEMLERVGCEVSFATTGSEAVEMVRASVYDIVLMDISMPEMDGLEATRIIRCDAGPHAHLPIVALTAHTLAEDREKIVANRMDALLSKPVSKHDLVTRLAQVFRSTAGRSEGSMATDNWHDGAAGADWPRVPGETRLMPEKTQNADENGNPDAFDPRPARAGDAALLDQSLLASLLGSLPAAMRDKVLLQFDADTRQRLAQVAEGMQSGDLEAIGAATHEIGRAHV